MLHYKNGRFIAGKVSFALPNDCYLVIMNAQNYYENGLEIADKQGRVLIEISAFHDKLPAKAFLDDLLDGDTFIRLSETLPIRGGTLDGYFAFYKAGTHHYCEYRFDVEDYNEINALQIFVCVEDCIDIKKVCASHIVQDLLAGLRKERY